MSNTAEPTNSPGAVRRFWWRTSQPTRLAIACFGVLTALAVTGVAGFAGGASTEERGPAAAVHRGDSFEVTVHTVSEVDSFEGVEPATGRFFDARVAGVSPTADCRRSESLATAQKLLRGKTVRLTVNNNDGDDGLVVDVRLPDGTDYARKIVDEGVAAADVSSRRELAPVELTARRERRGLWAAGCAHEDDAPITTASMPPTTTSSSTTAPTTTTTTTTTTTETTEEPSEEPSEPVTSAPPPSDDEWVDRIVGRRCFVEGAKRTSPKGTDVVCASSGRGVLRWRRAD